MKELLSHPETIDLDTFNREVWRFSTNVIAGGESLSKVIFGEDDVLAARLDELQHALDSGELDFHGNGTWGNAAAVYGAMLNKDVDRLANVRHAAEILNDQTRSPLQKAHALLDIEGFGPNIATGLVMLFHPKDFAIYNGPSREALRASGYPESTLEEFQESVRDLRLRVGAEDFIELDWFLYRHGVKLPDPEPPQPPIYVEPPFEAILAHILGQGMEIDEQTVRRYHLSLKVRGFVILAGVSGTGKTWLSEVYAEAVGACHRRIAVAPNWNSNEDLLGYFNPIDGQYHDTAFSDFLRQAAKEYRSAQEQKRTPVPYHLCLDELNLARVEYYFAAFLSAMEELGRMEREVELHGASGLTLPPNLLFVGTVNVDETTHGFADKVYDRAQLIELPLSREAVERFVGHVPYREVLMEIWTAVEPIAPFAFRVVRDIKAYVSLSGQDADDWHRPFDEQILQKVLPKLARTDTRVRQILTDLISITSRHGLELSCHKAERMLDGFTQYGFASYF